MAEASISKISDMLRAEFERVEATVYEPETRAASMKAGTLNGLERAILIAVTGERRTASLEEDGCPDATPLISVGEVATNLVAALSTREDAGERDYPAEFEAWWATYRHRNRDAADYPVKKQIAFDAFYHAALRASRELEGGAGEWIKRAMRFIDLCDADAGNYQDRGLHNDAADLTREGFGLFGMGNDASIADLEHALLRDEPQAREDTSAVAWVPIHPRNGPLWAEAGPDARDKENLKSYPFRGLYFASLPCIAEERQTGEV